MAPKQGSNSHSFSHHHHHVDERTAAVAMTITTEPTSSESPIDSTSAQPAGNAQERNSDSASPVAVSIATGSPPSIYDNFFHLHHDPSEEVVDLQQLYHSSSTPSLPSATSSLHHPMVVGNYAVVQPPPLIHTSRHNVVFADQGGGHALERGSVGSVPRTPILRSSSSSFSLQQRRQSTSTTTRDSNHTGIDNSPYSTGTFSTTSSYHHDLSTSRPRRLHLSSIRSNSKRNLDDNDDNETTPLFSKLQEWQQLEDPEYASLTSNHSSAYVLCGFCCSWLVWVGIWICIFAAVIHHYHNILVVAEPWTRLESIYFASATFWTVGYGDYTVSTNPERLVTCAFMMMSLWFMGLVLGRWGNSVLEAYKAASLAHASRKHQQRVRHVQQQRLAAQDEEMSGQSRFGMPTIRTINGNQHHHHYPQQHQEDDEFLIFPGLPWLLVQSIFLTALSIFCVFGIQYYEQDIDDQVKNGNDDWSAVSTIYFAISTATTVGYGDVVPKKKQGKLLAIFFLPLAVGTSIHWLVWVAQRGIQRIQRNMIHRSDLANLRLDEFYERKLQSMGLVDAATFAALKKEYDQLS